MFILMIIYNIASGVTQHSLILIYIVVLAQNIKNWLKNNRINKHTTSVVRGDLGCLKIH